MQKHANAAKFMAGWLICVTPFVLALLALPK